MRSVVGALVMAGIATAATGAQQKPAGTFRSSVALVAVDVTVLDMDGRPVSGLTAGDFEIKLNGKIQPIRAISYVQAPTAIDSAALDVPPTSAAGGRSTVSNAVAVKDPNIFVLAIDDLSFPPEAARRTMTAAQRFVDEQPQSVLVGLMTTSGSVVVNPTLDRAAVNNGLKHVVGAFIDPRKPHSPEMPSISIAEAIEIAEHNNTSVQNSAIVRECHGGGQNFQTATQNVSTAVSVYNTKCATDLLTLARLMATVTQGTTNRQIASLSNGLSAMTGAPGLKQMVVLSQGLAMTRDYLALFQPVTKAASAAGVQLSVLLEDDDDVDMATQEKGRDGTFGQLIVGGGTSLRRDDRKMFVTSLRVMADASGGTFERVITNPEGAFKRAALAGSAVYRLGVEAPADASSSKPLEVTASVAREGITWHVNHSAMLPRAAADESAADKVTAAIKRGKPYYAVPMRVAIARRRAADGQVELAIGVATPASVPGPLRVTIGLMDSVGGLKQGTRVVPVPSGGSHYTLTVPMPVAAGNYRVRLAVEDGSGAVGSVETRVDAALTPMGSLAASDLLTWWKDAAGRPQLLALDELPAGITNLSAGLELYRNGDTPVPADLKVRLSLFAAGAVAPIAEIDVKPRPDGALLRVESSLPLASLAAGRYLIRATVFAGSQPLGDVSAAFTKK